MHLRQKLKNIGLRKQKNLWSASIVLSISFAVSAALGLIRERVIYPRFLSCCPEQLDVYKAAFKLPDMVFKLLVTGALSASFMPIFLSHLQKDKKQAYALASTVINVLCLALCISLFVIYIFAWPFSRLLAPGFSQMQLLLMVRLTRILLIAQIFFLVSNFFTSIIQANQIFLVPSLSPILYNLSIIFATFFLSPKWGIYGVCFGAVIGSFLHFLIQLPLMFRLKFKYSLLFNTKIEGFRKIVRLMIPRSISIGLSEIESLFSLRWASLLPVGTFALYNLALQIIFLPSRIFSTTISQASMPILSRRLAENKIKKFKNIVIKSLFQGLFLSLPVTVLILVHRLPVVRLVFGSRNFPWSATLIIAKTITYLSPSIFLQSIIQVLNRAFYAAHDTKTPLKISLHSLIVSLTITFILVKFTNLAIISLAIGVSISNLIQSVSLLARFSQKIHRLNFAKFIKRLIKLFIASLFMAVSVWGSVRLMDNTIFDTSRTINLLYLVVTSSVIGILIFVFLCSLLKVKEIKDISKLIKAGKKTKS